MSVYETSRKLAITSIEKALVAHQSEEFLSIGNYLDEYEEILHEQDLEQGSLLVIAHEFLTGWSDCAAHDWHHWAPLKEKDWPRLAEIILQDLKKDQEVTDPELLSEFRFIVKPRISIVSKIWSIICGQKT